MGSNTSKSSTETAAISQNNELDKDVCRNPDPRSPTPEITRTPLQNKNGGKHNITKNVDLRKTFESNNTEGKLIHNNPILSAVIKNHLQSYDPRSPTQDFERTPIVLSNDLNENIEKKHYSLDTNCGSPCLNNDTIENNQDSSFEIKEVSPDFVVPINLFDKFVDMSLDGTLKDTDEPLGSSTASNEVIENEISTTCPNPTKLLETNFDCIGTVRENIEEGNEDIETVDECINSSEDDVKNIPIFEILAQDPRSPSIGIERTPIVVAKTEDVVDGNVEEMSDDSLIKALQNTELHQNNVPDMNPDGILIYEDQSNSLNDTPKKSKSSSNSGSRTPLSCMKNKTDTAHPRSKSTNTLYDNKNKTKLQKRVSHIPRLKSLIKHPTYVHTGSSISLKNITKSSAISGDCENTPPHSHRDIWDKDNSIVL